MKAPVLFGIDQFLQQKEKYRHLKFALVTNDAATTSHGVLSRQALSDNGFRLMKLFSPEHGLTCRGEDGAYQENAIDPVTKLPVISLYGDDLMPSQEDLGDVDAVVFDIPDVGCRFYTYPWTMTFVMEACATFNKPLLILDRPNPIGGDLNLSEGPMLDEKNCSSFIGRWSIPIRHCCTYGELANYFSSKKNINCDLSIVRTVNWERKDTITTGGWDFVRPSPAITDEETLFFYPGLGLLEGINVNEGRGTNSPFKIFGAPWMDNLQMQEAFSNLKLAGVSSRPVSYKPASGLYAKEFCFGLSLALTDENLFRPVHAGLQLIKLIAELYPDKFEERAYKTRANPEGKDHLDKLLGIYHSLNTLRTNDIEIISSSSHWKETISQFLLY